MFYLDVYMCVCMKMHCYFLLNIKHSCIGAGAVADPAMGGPGGPPQ